jgi:hypothetical protein
MHVGGCLQKYVLYVLFEAAWWLSVSYMRQDGGYLSATWGRMTVKCQFHEDNQIVNCDDYITSNLLGIDLNS